MQQQSKIVRIFVSSTFRDMHAERDHLVTVVFPMLRERLEQLGIEFYDVDLRWGVPKTGVDGELANPWAYCRQWIDRVEPFFISLLGERYGWVPASEDISDAADRETYKNISITEMEIRHAILDSNLNRLGYFYFRDQSIPENIDPEIRKEYDDGSHKDQLAALKSRIAASGRPVRYYPCRWIGTSLSELDQFGQMVLEDIWSGVMRDERYVSKSAWREVLGHDPESDSLYTDFNQWIPEELWKRIVAQVKPGPADPFEREIQEMRIFAESRLRWFQGRTKEISQLEEFVHGNSDADTSRLAVLRAVPGQGKSALLAKLAEKLRESQYWVFEHFAGATAGSTDIHFLLDHLLHSLNSSGIKFSEINDDTPDLRRRLFQRLANYQGTRRIVIIVDGVDQVGLEWLPNTLGLNVRVIISYAVNADMMKQEQSNPMITALQSRIPEPKWVELSSLDQNDVRNIVTAYLLEYCKQLDQDQIDTICGMEQARNPLYLLVMLGELRMLGGNDMHRIVPELIADLRLRRPETIDLFDWVLERLEVFGQEAVSRFCAYLATSRTGLSGRELSDLLEKQLGSEGKKSSHRIERGLRRYLFFRGNNLDFFHGQLRQAAERRYLQGVDISEFHREIAMYFHGQGIEDDHALTEMAWHLSQGKLADKLFSLIGNPEFRRRRISSRGTVYDLCTDIKLAFTTALENDDMLHIAQFGFMHADYYEGRFGKQDVLELYRHDPPAARLEANLFRGPARFRLLVLLALRELDAGQMDHATRLIAQASEMHGVKLPASEGPFLSGVVGRCTEAGICNAFQLLPTVLTAKDVFPCALAAVNRSNSSARQLLLSEIVNYLDQDFRDPNGTHPVSDFDSVIQKVILIENTEVRNRLLDIQSGTINEVITLFDVSVNQQDVMGGITLMLTQSFASGLEGKDQEDKEKYYTRDDYVTALQASLGSAKITMGNDADGYRLLEGAVDICLQKSTSVGSIHHLTMILRRHPSPESLYLLRQLVTKSNGKNKDSLLGAVLEILIANPGGDEIVEILDVIESGLKSVPLKQRILLLDKLALAYGACGRQTIMQQIAKNLHLSVGLLILVPGNPLITADSKFTLLYSTVEKITSLHERDLKWSGIWIARMAKWTGKISSSSEQIKNLIKLLKLASEYKITEGFQAVFETILSLKNDDICTTGLEAVLDSLQSLDNIKRAKFRALSWERMESLPSPAHRARIQRAWWRSAVANEKDLFQNAMNVVIFIQDPGLRGKIWGEIASTLEKCGLSDSAEQAWYEAVVADQDVSTANTAVGARTVAATKYGTDQEWSKTISGVNCPDIAYAEKIALLAAHACPDPKRLKELEHAVKQLKWRKLELKSVATMYLAVARAWGKAGYPQRGSQLALHVLKRIRSNYEDQALLADLIATGLMVQNCPKGRQLLVSLVPFVFAKGHGKPNRLTELAKGVANIRDDTFSKILFTHIYCAALDLEYGLPWQQLTAVAEIAEALADRGQADLAKHILEHTKRPAQHDNTLDAFFENSSSAIALGTFCLAYAKVYLILQDRDLYSTLLALCREVLKISADIKDDTERREACHAQILVWKASSLADLPLKEEALAAAEESARVMSCGAINRWHGFKDLSMAWLTMGNEDQSLSVAREILDDKTRDELLINLTGLVIDQSQNDLVKLWKEIASPDAGRDAAWSIVRTYMRQVESFSGRVCNNHPVQWPFRKYRSYLFMAGTAITAAGYSLCWGLWPFVHIGLTGPDKFIWITSLTAFMVVCVSILSYNQRNDSGMSNPLLRLGVSILILPFLPIALAVWLCDRWKEANPSLRAWWFNFRSPLRAKQKIAEGNENGTTKGMRQIRRLLSVTVEESVPFDFLLSTLIFDNQTIVKDSNLINALPEILLPKEIPAKKREEQREWDEYERKDRWFVKLKEKLKSVLNKTGIFLSIGLIYVPLTFWTQWNIIRKENLARKLGQKGYQLINQNQAAKAVGILKRAVKYNPEIPEYWNNLSLALSTAGQKAEALDAARQACEKGRNSIIAPSLWYNLGYELFQCGRYQDALKAFNQVLSITKPGTRDYLDAEQGKNYCLSNLGMR